MEDVANFVNFVEALNVAEALNFVEAAVAVVVN